MSNPWFRLYSEFATDPKIQMLSEADQRRFIMLLCNRCNGHVTLQDEEVTFLLRISNESWQVTKSVFIEKGLINNDNELLNWDKRQFVSDSSAERVARHRAKKKQQCNVTVTPQNRTDTEQIQNREKKEKINKKENLLFDVDEEIANDFIQLRKQKKAPLTKTSVDGIRREADKAGITLQDALKECCTRGWQGFKAEWYKNSINSPNQRGSPSVIIGKQSAIEQQNAIVASSWVPPELRKKANE